MQIISQNYSLFVGNTHFRQLSHLKTVKLLYLIVSYPEGKQTIP